MQTTIDGCSIHYDLHGTGDSILFVHGFPLTGEMWTPTIRLLPGHWRSIVPDLRGHGRSEATRDASMGHYADDLAALLEHVGEKRPVVVVGLSMGGYVAFEFFRSHRRRVRALVLCDTRANPDTPEAVAKRQAMAESVLREGSRFAADAMIGQLFAPTASEGLKSHWQKVMATTAPVGVAAALLAMAHRPDSAPTLGQINVPTMCVVGEHDKLTPPANMEEIHRGVRGSRYEIIKDAGHMTPVEQPEAFTRVLHSFLSGLPEAV